MHLLSRLPLISSFSAARTSTKETKTAPTPTFAVSEYFSLEFARTTRQQLLAWQQHQEEEQQQQGTPCLLPFWGCTNRRQVALLTDSSSSSKDNDISEKTKIRIGIVGGGIAGVSSAHALAQRQRRNGTLGDNHHCEIVILEAGMPSPQEDSLDVDSFSSSNKQPLWIAATARNGNSIVPGASFSVLSQKSTLVGVARDTINEWFQLHQPQRSKNDNDDALFASVPPYFDLNLWRCLFGPTTTPTERASFVRFVGHFLYNTVWLGQTAAQDRARHLGELAQANRNIYLHHVLPQQDDNLNIQKKKSDLAKAIGHSQGFLSIYRSQENAEKALKHVRAMGEEAEAMDWETALQYEPRLWAIPDCMKPLFVVRRPNDYTASCNVFVRNWIQACQDMGVQHYNSKVDTITRARGAKVSGEKSFRVVTTDGSVHEFDLLVLAAGPGTPLLAAQLGAGKYCPTYPLRGFSLTTYFPKEDGAESNDNNKHQHKQQSKNQLQQPFQLDSMYCSSVSPRMARWVGFGEFAGYGTTAQDVPSVAPSVLARYANRVFPDGIQVGEAMACFRALSPDDLPLVGQVSTVDGLFLNTGHGTLGWTLGMATGEMLALAIDQKLQGRSSDDNQEMFQLSDGTRIDPKVYSPGRFVT